MAEKNVIQKKIYLDHGATTPLANEVYREMLDSYQEAYGNASSLHSFGRDASRLIETARERVAKAIHAKPNEIYFTSGGTESNNWAILGIARANKNKGNHIITSTIEHPSILEACKQLEKEGFVVTYIPVDQEGVIDYAELVKAISSKTILISIMAANNEVGTIQPLRAIAELAKAHKICFHTDAIQAMGALEIDVANMGIGAMSISAHKINGPKGVGVLYVKKGVEIQSFMLGGEQEKGLRAGTYNTQAIVGMGKAAELAVSKREENVKTLKNVKRYFLRKVNEVMSNVILNGHPTNRLPGNVNLSFEGVEGESLLMMLDMAGIAVSTGSACASGSAKASHVLLAMGIDEDLAKSSIRFTFGTDITPTEVDYVVEQLRVSVKKLRAISPIRIYKVKGVQ